mmetsp:Transcript_26723/g.55475  ORF Transcript_26723/g.55475 Transcript_26723/m.55475 type:complete len:228 (-) Transcript_26723:605-1288(-)
MNPAAMPSFAHRSGVRGAGPRPSPVSTGGTHSHSPESRSNPGAAAPPAAGPCAPPVSGGAGGAKPGTKSHAVTTRSSCDGPSSSPSLSRLAICSSVRPGIPRTAWGSAERAAWRASLSHMRLAARCGMSAASERALSSSNSVPSVGSTACAERSLPIASFFSRVARIVSSFPDAFGIFDQLNSLKRAHCMAWSPAPCGIQLNTDSFSDNPADISDLMIVFVSHTIII